MTDEQRDLLMLAAARYARSGEGRRIRERVNMQQQEMARRIGITTSGLWRWEHGKRRPQGDAAVKWAQQLTRLELVSAHAESAA